MFIQIRKNLFILASLLLLSIQSNNLTFGKGLPDDLSLTSQIDEIVAPSVDAKDFMGVVAVQRDGEDPLLLAYGLASVELGVPHKASDIFMIGSISKQFTAAAILLLEEKGALNTNDPVRNYLPDFKYGGKITIEQLLNHTSGVVDIYSLKRFGETAGQAGTFAEVLNDLSHLEPTFPPGSSYGYSNGGYAILAAIIERVSGIPYGEFLDRHIFKPLKMNHTSHDSPKPVVSNHVPGYDPWGDEKLTPVHSLSVAFSTGSGSLWSSATDLLKWNYALYNKGLLGEISYKKFSQDYGNAYGYGVSVYKRFDRDVIGHDGRVAGYASDIARYLKDRLTIIILSNVQSAARDEIRRLVAAAALGEPYSIPQRRIYNNLQGISIDEYVGIYSFGPGFKVSITESNGRLLARANEGGFSEIIPLNETEWFSRMLYATIRFGRDEKGVVDRLIWGRGKNAPVGQRID
jgi:CubicO group peptidase (beta-lactamase class C family)